MKSIWFFWTKPFKTHRSGVWSSEKHHLLAWVLSLETARKHYPDTCLFTDDEGARTLIDGIGLEFEQVSTALNTLDGYDPEWWALGKIYTYRAQTKPFIHIDNDVFLWKPLPRRIESAPVFAQNPEYFSEGYRHYKPQEFQAVVKSVKDGWLPEEFEWCQTGVSSPRGACCGICGGNDIHFIRSFANTAMKIIEHPSNQSAWVVLNEKTVHVLLVEQYLLAAYVDYHRNKQGSPHSNVDIQYLFNSANDAFNSNKAEEMGYTHLMSAKRSKKVANLIEKRVSRDYPEQYERCIRYLADYRKPGTE